MVFGQQRMRVAHEKLPLACFASAGRVFIPKALENEFAGKSSGNLRRQTVDGNWILLDGGRVVADTAYQTRFIAAAKGQSDNMAEWMLGEWFFERNKLIDEPSRLMKLWMQIIRQPLIPYDMTERRKQLTHAFSELAALVGGYEQLG
jgi:hypothetical protein